MLRVGKNGSKDRTGRYMTYATVAALLIGLAGGCQQQAADGVGGGSTAQAAPVTDKPTEVNKTAALETLSIKPASTEEIQNPRETAHDSKSADPNAPVEARTPVATAKTGETDAHQDRFLGTWETYDNGKRVLKVMKDGTATVNAVLDDYRQYIVGSKLKFDLKWWFHDGKLTMETTGGHPADMIDYITSIYGEIRTYDILEFTDEKLTLKRIDNGEVEPDWVRVAVKDK